MHTYIYIYVYKYLSRTSNFIRARLAKPPMHGFSKRRRLYVTWLRSSLHYKTPKKVRPEARGFRVKPSTAAVYTSADGRNPA